MPGNTNNGIAFLCLSAQSALDRFWGREPEPDGRPYWSDEELTILHRHYEQDGLNVCLELLPNRTPQSIDHKVRRLGLKRRNIAYWTRTELDIVIRSLARGENCQETYDRLIEEGYDRTLVAVRDCRIKMERQYLEAEPVAARL